MPEKISENKTEDDLENNLIVISHPRKGGKKELMRLVNEEGKTLKAAYREVYGIDI